MGWCLLRLIGSGLADRHVVMAYQLFEQTDQYAPHQLMGWCSVRLIGSGQADRHAFTPADGLRFSMADRP